MKREIILTAAARLFAERGFANTPTALLAQEAGVAEGTIFRHFKTKDEIFYVLMDRVRDDLLEDMQKMLAARKRESGLETVLDIVREFCIFVRRNPLEFGLVFRDASSRYGDMQDRAFLAIRALYEELGFLIYNAIGRGIEDGSIDPAICPQDTSSLLVCQLMGFMRGLHFNLVLREGEEGQIFGCLLENTRKLLRAGS